MDKILCYPNDGDQLVEMFLDQVKYTSLIKKLDLYQRYMGDNLTEEEHTLPCFQKSYKEIAKKYVELEQAIFHAAVDSLIDEVCRRQVDSCVVQHLDAPWGKEMEWIQDSPRPDIYLQGQYEKLCQWYSCLSENALYELVRLFKDEFGPLIPDESNFEDKCSDCWNLLPLEDQERIYQHYNPQ